MPDGLRAGRTVAPPRPRWLDNPWVLRGLRLGSLLSLVVIWEVVARSGLAPPRLTPSITRILEEFRFGLEGGDILYHGWFSVQRALTGFGLAILVGVPLGALLARSRLFEAVFEPVFTFGYPVPKIALYPIFIFVFGLGSESKIAMVFLECLYPIVLSTYAGIRNVNPVLVRAARNMGAGPLAVFWRVSVPAAAPEIFAGIRVALPFAMIVIILVELIGDSVGLGYWIAFKSASFEYAAALAGLLAVAIIGFTLDRTLLALRIVLMPWERAARRG